MGGIVDPVVFDRVGRILDENRHRVKHRHTRGRLDYLLSGIVRCKTCGSFMPGKSATGNGGKFGYYEHSWATKRDSTLSKKIFACDPHRVPAKVLEETVWSGVVAFLTKEEKLVEMLNRLRKQSESNPLTKERDRLRAKIAGINSQLEGVAERIAELPKGISAAPLYKQMQKLESVKNEYEASLALLSESGQGRADRIVQFDALRAFAKHYKEFLTQDSNPQQRNRLIRKFVEKVEVGVDSIRINFFVDKKHYERELAIAESGSASGKPIKGFSRFLGSQTLTNGPQDWT